MAQAGSNNDAMGLYRTSKSNSCLPPYLFVPARGDAEVCPVLGHQLMLDPNGDVHEGEGVQLGQHRIEPIHHGLGSWVNIVKNTLFLSTVPMYSTTVATVLHS